MPKRDRDTDRHDQCRTTPTRGARARTLGAALLALGAAAVVWTAPAAAASSPPPAADCQPFAARPCLLPFPNNLFTVKDASTSTGLRIHLPANAMPANGNRQRVSVAQYDRNDGWSPGSAMIAHVPGLDNPTAFAKTKAVGLLNMSAEFAPSQPIVVIDEATGKRQLVYSELDSNAPTPADTNLLIMPGKELTEGHTYVVALRSLRDSAGKLLSAPAWFEKLRDNKPLPADEQSQKARYQKIFASLVKAGIPRSNLYQAWDFTVGSEKSLTSRLLRIRNNAFAQLGDTNLADGVVQGSPPTFSVTGTSSIDNNQLEDIQGTFPVPCYLVTCGPTATTGFHYSSKSPDALPTQISGNIATADFECIVPASATPANPARLSLYGHGLLGDRGEVTDGWVQALATGYNMAFCATDWWGLASGDTALAAEAVANLNKFPPLVDRLQQGVLNFLYLGRLMSNPQGFAANADFQSAAQPVIDTSNLYYDGNSQGGIEGGLTTAVSPDFTRAVLGVTGLDYGNLLIQRSTDFGVFKTILEGKSAYPDQSMYPVICDLIQQLWDRGDPDGYAPQMTSQPLPDTPSHVVLEQIAYGDHQVSMYAGVAEARTIGADVYQPALDAVRSRDVHLFYKVPAIPSLPFAGSAITIWDSGPGRVLPPPVGNIPPMDTSSNHDPHEDPRNTPAAQQQDSAFWEPAGAVTDTCNAMPCHTQAYVP